MGLCLDEVGVHYNTYTTVKYRYVLSARLHCQTHSVEFKLGWRIKPNSEFQFAFHRYGFSIYAVMESKIHHIPFLACKAVETSTHSV